MVTLPLFRSVQTAAKISDSVLVSFSGGKDSVVTLSLCVRHFKKVEAFFMYYVKGLSFQENIISYYEDKYGIKIHRIPHFELSNFFRYGTFRPYDFDVPIVSVRATYNYAREVSGIYWIAAGERIADSIWRRAMIKNSGSIDFNRGRFYPIAEWNKQEVLSYIKQNRLRVGAESEKLGFSFRSFMPEELLMIRHHYEKDYKKIKDWFPFVDASVVQYEQQKK